jgi:hypothetical protein
MWIHEQFDIDRPKVDLSEYEPLADGTDPMDLPTIGSLWCLRKVMTSLYVILRVMSSLVRFTDFSCSLQHVWAGEQPKKAYKDFVGQIIRMVDAQVRWTLYAPAMVAARAPQGSRACAPETRLTS